MARTQWITALALLGALPAQDWAGRWHTTRGPLTITVDGDRVDGRYGDGSEHVLTGERDGDSLRASFEEGGARGTARLRLDPDGRFFAGRWEAGALSGGWRGWRAVPASGPSPAVRGPAARVGGAWRTSLGTLELDQRARALSGRCGNDGATVRGEVRGRVVELEIDRPLGVLVRAELRDDGWLYGASGSGADERRFVARPLADHARDPLPAAGAEVRAIAANLLTYRLRAPAGYRPGRAVDAIVFLHGRFGNAARDLDSLEAQGDFAKDRLLIGIDGDVWIDRSEPDAPAHEFTFVRWAGRSTEPVQPGAERQAPALIGELVSELRRRLRLRRVLVGGHSQGGILSYFLAMHFPDLVDGVFPCSGAATLQCMPDRFDDGPLQAAQRGVPIAMVHGRADRAITFRQCEETLWGFQAEGFPLVRLFANDAGHDFAALRVAEAVEWLDVMSGAEPAPLLALAETALAAGQHAGAGAALTRLRHLRVRGDAAARLRAAEAEFEGAAAKAAAPLLDRMRDTTDPGWIEEFWAFRERFGATRAAAPVLAAYAPLRRTHDPEAERLIGEAFLCTQRGDAAGRRARYEEIITRWFATARYRHVKAWLGDE